FLGGSTDGNQIISRLFHISCDCDNSGNQRFLSQNHICCCLCCSHVGHNHAHTCRKSSHGNFSAQHALNQLALSSLAVLRWQHLNLIQVLLLKISLGFHFFQDFLKIFDGIRLIILDTDISLIRTRCFQHQAGTIDHPISLLHHHTAVT